MVLGRKLIQKQLNNLMELVDECDLRAQGTRKGVF